MDMSGVESTMQGFERYCAGSKNEAAKSSVESYRVYIGVSIYSKTS